MAIEQFLGHIRARFEPQTAREIVSAFRADQLAWQYLESTLDLARWLAYAADDLSRWQLGVLGLFSLDPSLPEQDLTNLQVDLPSDLNERAEKAFEMTRLTGLEPATLPDAALLALYLREFRQKAGSWKGLPETLLAGKCRLADWKTALAILTQLVPDYESAIDCLFSLRSPENTEPLAALVIHQVTVNPADESARYQTYHRMLQKAPVDLKISALRAMRAFEDGALIKLLANSFLAQEQTSAKETNQKSAESEVETFRQQAVLSQMAGQPTQASRAIDQAFNALNRQQAEILRSLALELEIPNPEEARKTWEEIMRLQPENASYKKEYAEFLIAHDDAEYGSELLSEIPDDATKALFALRYPVGGAPDSGWAISLDKALEKKTLQTSASRFSADSDNLIAARYAFDNKKYQTAGAFIRKALSESPNNLEALKLSSQIDRHLANIDDAIKASELLAVYDPQNAENKQNLASLYLQSQQPGNALQILQDLIHSSDDPSRADLLNFAEVSIKAAQPEQAIPIAEAFLKIDGFDGEALVLLCKALIASGKSSEAVELLEKTSAIAPEKPSSWLSLARIWTSLAQEDKALQALRKAKAALPDDPAILSALGELYLANDQPTEAISVLRQAFQLDPTLVNVRKSLAQAYLNHGYIDDAWQTIAPLEDDYTSDPELASVLGQVLMAIGDLTGAKPVMRFAWQANRSDTTLKAYAELLIRSYSKGIKPGNQELKEMSQLLAVMEERQQEREGLFDLRLLQADLKASLGMHEAAYSEYLQLMDYPEAKAPRSYHHLHFQTGQTALALGLTDISLASLQEAVLTDPDDLPSRYALANALMTADLENEGLSTARSALQIAPTDIENVLWFSDFMSQHNRARDTIQLLKDTIQLRPDDKALYLTLARTYVNLNQIEDTKDILNRMLALEDIETEEYIKVANLYLHMNQADEAARVIKKAISDNPSPDFAESRDLVYSVLKLGDSAAARKLLEDLEPALQSNPAYPLLKSDVLAANRAFVPAFDALEDTLSKLEFAPDSLGSIASDETNPYLDYPPYNRSGLYYRAAQLERITGDLVAAQKFAALALNADPSSEQAYLLKLELALTTSQVDELSNALDYLNTQQAQPQMACAMAAILTLDAVLRDDLPRARLLWDHFLADSPSSPMRLALQSLFSSQSGDTELARKQLAEAAELLTDHQAFQPAASFDISRHFAWVWHALAVAKAAWQLGDWRLADQSLKTVLLVAKINPIANKLLADYLTDKARQLGNAERLHLLRHAPEAFDPQRSEFDVIEEQVSLAGRALPPSEVLPALKISQALRQGQWMPENELHKLVTNGKQAAQVFSVVNNEQVIAEILAGFSKDPDVSFQQAIQNLSEDPNTSAEIAARLLESQPEDPVLHALLAIATRNNPLKAAESFETALSIWSDEPDWHAMAALQYQDAGDYPQAAKHLEEAIRISPKDAHYWQMLGDVKLLERDYNAAKDYFGKATDLFPTNPEALYSLAIINQQLGEHKIAIQCLQKASQLDPDNLIYDEAIARSLLARQVYQEAIQQADLILKKDPKSETAWDVKTKAYSLSGKTEEARQAINFALAVVENPVPFELQKINLDQVRNPHQALPASQRLAEAYPEDTAVLNNLALKLIQAGEVDKAETVLQRSLILNPTNPETLVNLGTVDRLRGNLDQALAHLSEAIRLQPGFVEAYLEMGLTYQDRRDVGSAIQTYHKAIAMVSNDPRPYLQAAAAYKDSRDYRNAEYMLRQASQLSPSDQNIRRQLASVVALNIVNNLQEAPKK